MSIALRTLSCAALLLLAAGCGERAETQNEAVAVANAYLATMPLAANTRRVEAVDMGDRWRLAYIAAEGSTGGPIVVVVNKRSGEVVHWETEQ